LFSNSQRGSTERPKAFSFFLWVALNSKGFFPLACSGFSDSPFPSRRPVLLVFVPVVSGTRCRVVACWSLSCHSLQSTTLPRSCVSFYFLSVPLRKKRGRQFYWKERNDVRNRVWHYRQIRTVCFCCNRAVMIVKRFSRVTFSWSLPLLPLVASSCCVNLGRDRFFFLLLLWNIEEIWNTSWSTVAFENRKEKLEPR